jgi:long-chain fatty acid transport protein
MLACALAGLPALVFWVQDALAAGFAIKEQSGSALGNAFAGSATGIDDISYSFYNPAMMTYLSGNHAAAAASYIIPDANFKDGSASNIASAPITTTSNFNGNKDIGRDALVPAFYGMWSATEDLKLGFSVTAPFGLLTDNVDGWEGRYHALKSDLLTIDINPAVAYRVLPNLSIGGGFRALYADAELSNNIDYGTIAGGSPSEATDGRAKLQGDDWGFGFNLGVMYSPIEKLRLGLAYRSSIDLDIEGDTKFDDDPAGFVDLIRLGASDPTLFTDTDAEASLDLPDSVAFGANYDITGDWAVMGQVEWWNWSNFDELRIEFDNPSQPDNVTEEDWNDSWFFAVGTTYKPRQIEGLTLRLGLAFDESPVPDDTRTPRIPDEDRYWIAVGVGYTPLPWLTLDLGYTHIFIPDADIDLKATDPGNTFRGNLSGEYEASIDIVGFQVTARF